MTIAAVVIAAIPSLYALVAAPIGSSYLGFQYNTDDHMVYAAWMRQAMDGRFFFDNRFTTAAQPGLTVHLYFWALGLLAKITGIPLAANLTRLFFTGLFVPLLYRLIQRVTPDRFAARLALLLAIFGGGLGFLVWHSFGLVIVRPAPEALKTLFNGLLPTDVWQPEAFVLPSMLTSSLFMVSLCLIVTCFLAFLSARDSWKRVGIGAVALGLLMNIHSYDVLIVGLAMVGLLVMQLAARQAPREWIVRALVITLGVLPAALWFVHVLRSDPVFQSRAATPTYSPSFTAVFYGYFGLILLGIAGLFVRAGTTRKRVGACLVAALVLGMLILSRSHDANSFFMSAPLWVLVAAVAAAALAWLAEESPAYNLILSWAVLGSVGLYFPALFERKLAMGLSIPWSVLAALALSRVLAKRPGSERRLVTALAGIVLSLSSVLWVVRMITVYIPKNVANTTMHPVYLTADQRAVVEAIDKDPRPRKVVISMPGVWSPELDKQGNRLPDQFAMPLVPDLNPIISGFTGAYTYAGHWSETPGYERLRSQVTKVYLPQTSPEERTRLLTAIEPDYIVQPVIDGIAELSGLGQVVYSGKEWRLIKLK